MLDQLTQEQEFYLVPHQSVANHFAARVRQEGLQFPSDFFQRQFFGRLPKLPANVADVLVPHLVNVERKFRRQWEEALPPDARERLKRLIRSQAAVKAAATRRQNSLSGSPKRRKSPKLVEIDPIERAIQLEDRSMLDRYLPSLTDKARFERLLPLWLRAKPYMKARLLDVRSDLLSEEAIREGLEAWIAGANTWSKPVDLRIPKHVFASLPVDSRTKGILCWLTQKIVLDEEPTDTEIDVWVFEAHLANVDLAAETTRWVSIFRWFRDGAPKTVDRTMLSPPARQHLHEFCTRLARLDAYSAVDFEGDVVRSSQVGLIMLEQLREYASQLDRGVTECWAIIRSHLGSDPRQFAKQLIEIF